MMPREPQESQDELHRRGGEIKTPTERRDMLVAHVVQLITQQGERTSCTETGPGHGRFPQIDARTRS